MSVLPARSQFSKRHSARTDIEDPDNNAHGFRFDHQGVRVPALVVSPLIPSVQASGVGDRNCNLIDHTQYDHGSLLATVEQIYGLSPLTNRDATAKEFSHLLSLATPRSDAPWTLPQAAKSGFNCNDDAGNPPSGPKGPLAEPVPPGDSHPIAPSLRGIVELAGIIDARLHPTNKVEIARRIRGLSSVADAHAYLTRVNAQPQAHRQRTIAAGISAKTARNRRRNRRVAAAKTERE